MHSDIDGLAKMSQPYMLEVRLWVLSAGFVRVLGLVQGLRGAWQGLKGPWQLWRPLGGTAPHFWFAVEDLQELFQPKSVHNHFRKSRSCVKPRC